MKQKFRKICRKHKNINAHLEYKNQANKASKVVRSAKRNLERNIANILTYSKYFHIYTYVRSKVELRPL